MRKVVTLADIARWYRSLRSRWGLRSRRSLR